MTALGKRPRHDSAPDASSRLEPRASLLSLPDEVIDDIGRYLWQDRASLASSNVQQKDLAALSWSCRRLRRQFLPQVWQSIRLVIRWDALETAEVIVGSNGQGEFVNSVIVELDEAEEFDGIGDLLETVLSHCPSLKHLQLSAVRLQDDCAPAIVETVCGGLRRSMRRVETFQARIVRPVTLFAKAIEDLLGKSCCLTSLTLAGREDEELDEDEEGVILDPTAARALRERIGTLSHLEHLSVDLDVFRGLLRRMREVPQLIKVELHGITAEDRDVVNLCSLAAPSLESLTLLRGPMGRPRPICLPRLQHLSFLDPQGNNPLGKLVHPFSPLRHYEPAYKYVNLERDVAAFHEAQEVKTLRRISLDAGHLAAQTMGFPSLTDDEDDTEPISLDELCGPLKAWGDKNAVAVDLGGELE